MNRRAFLARSSFLATAALLTRTLRAQSPAAGTLASTAPATQFRPLRRDVGVFTGRGGTIGWLANADGLVIVDTQFPDTAAVCLEGLPTRSSRMIDVVINTHHHPDHTSGNAVFKPAARTLVAHANVPKLQSARAERDNTLERQVYADTTFDTIWRREIGSEIVTAQYHGPAHTSGDIVVHFERANVVHMGDLTFNRLYPVIDRPGGASIRGWIKVLESVANEYPADAIYVFGHGSSAFGITGERSDLLVFRDYLSALLAHVEKEIAAGKSKDEIVTLANMPGFPDLHVTPPQMNRFPGNVSTAYDELTAANP